MRHSWATIAVVATMAALTAMVPAVGAVTESDGTGTLVVTPLTETAGHTGTTLYFTYTAGAGGTSSGEVDVVVPASWSPPSTSSSAAGYVTSTCGTVGTTGATIKITSVTLAAASECFMDYGSTSGGSSGATAAASVGTDTFTTSEMSTVSGTLTPIAASPSVTVTRAPSQTGVDPLSSVYYGEEDVRPVYFLASSPLGGAATSLGTVSIKAGTRTICTGASVPLNGQGACELGSTTLSAGRHVFVARYSGTANIAPSTSLPETMLVRKLGSTTTLKLSAASVTYGSEQKEHLTVHVTFGFDKAPATGSVIVKAGSSGICSIKLSGGRGSCSLSAKQLAKGTWYVTATYRGSVDLIGSTSPRVRLIVTK